MGHGGKFELCTTCWRAFDNALEPLNLPRNASNIGIEFGRAKNK